MPFIVSKQMEKIVTDNFQILNTFEQDIKTLRMQEDSRKSVKESLLNRLDELIIKVFTSLIIVFVLFLFHYLQALIMPFFFNAS